MQERVYTSQAVWSMNYSCVLRSYISNIIFNIIFALQNNIANRQCSSQLHYMIYVVSDISWIAAESRWFFNTKLTISVSSDS